MVSMATHSGFEDRWMPTKLYIKLGTKLKLRHVPFIPRSKNANYLICIIDVFMHVN